MAEMHHRRDVHPIKRLPTFARVGFLAERNIQSHELMNDNPYKTPTAFEIGSGSDEEPVVKNDALHFLKKFSATLLWGTILASFNFIGGTSLTPLTEIRAL
jgi:hypothetical protein